MTIDFAADARNMFSTDEFAQLASVTRQNHADLVDITVVLNRDVEIISSDGTLVQNRDIASVLATDMAEHTEGDQMTVGLETFLLQELVGDNGHIRRVYCRKVNNL
ncbi:MAG: hypothetical protein JKY93_00495 [Gammaproteobacteria bacterium]|nr:hypothetical protein [Gammaproteobacteria bacterium]